MKITDNIKKYRNAITIVLTLIGIGLMIYYDYCDTACSYLQGDIWGIDLKWFGIAYMVAIIAFAAFRQTPFVRVLLAAGLGVEVFLFVFQIRNNVFCPFCIAFAAIVIAAFIVNYEASPAWRENQRKMWLYFLGEVDLPMFRIHKLPLLVVSLLGYFLILLTFSGSVTPAYGQDKISGIPSMGQGNYEVILFADYFCPPCRMIDAKAEPVLKELLASEKVKITFVDVPRTKVTPIYARTFLYTVNAGVDADKVFHIRKTLFDAAQVKHIQTEDALINYLKEEKIARKKLDEKPEESVTFENYLKAFDYQERSNMKIGIPEMLQLYKQGMVQIIDVRFPEEHQVYSFGFMKHIPLNELPTRLNELDSMIAIASIMGIKKTFVYCSIVVVLSTIAGMGYGLMMG
jgi:thiol-disulfide isomerase/thioredoxin